MNWKSLGIFAMGSFFGALGMWLGVKTYYEKKCNDEIAEIKKAYTYKKPEESKEEKPLERKEVTNMHDIIKHYNYSNLGENDEDDDERVDPIVDPSELESPKDDDSESDEPYEIQAEEAGYGRDCVACTYFANDGILAENNSQPNNYERIDIGESIGDEGLKRCLEEWEDSPDAALYFRNNRLGLDYEVLRTEESYNDYVRAWNGIEDQ